MPCELNKNADFYSLRVYLNSLLRDFSDYPKINITKESVEIEHDNDRLVIEIEKFSLTGSHRYKNKILRNNEVISFEQFVDITGHLLGADETFKAKVIKSRDEIAKNLDLNIEQNSANNFLNSEQGLLLGHPFHPFPKFKGNITEKAIKEFSPEYKSKFKLIWICLNDGEGFISEMGSTVKLEELRAFDLEHRGIDKKNWIPLHPLQYDYLVSQGIKVQGQELNNIITMIGEKEWSACSSMRTLYHDDAPCFIKFSLPVKLTNSIRFLNEKDLERSSVINQVFNTDHLSSFFERNSHFSIQLENTYGGIVVDQKKIDESIFQLREPLRGSPENSYVLATLCEERLEESLLLEMSREAWSKLDIAEVYKKKEWFSDFLNVVFQPILRLAFEEGVLLGAHLQNLIVEFENGKATSVEYRDCQGTGLSSAGWEKFGHLLSEDVLVIDDENIKKVFGYYLVVNSIMSVVSTLSKDSSEELVLLDELRKFFNKLRLSLLKGKAFFDYWIESEYIYQKGNFRCSLNSNDENTMANPWAIYNKIDNPLAQLRKLRSYGYENLHEKINPRNGKKISIRKLDLRKDLEVFHEWHNKDFVSEFWELNKSKQELEQYIQDLYDSTYQLPLIVELDNSPIGYFEIYWAYSDRIAPYCDAKLYDRGIHLLIGEEKILRTRHVFDALGLITEFCFLDEKQTDSVWGEPRADNTNIIKFAQALPGWEVLHEFSFPHKRSRLLRCSRDLYIKETSHD